jgi:hypothetical protein
MSPDEMMRPSAPQRMEKRGTPRPIEKRSAPVEKKSSALPHSPALLPLLAVATLADEPATPDPLADLPLEMLPLKPFLQARYIALALDGGDSIKLEGRLFYRNADDARDGEAAVRMLLYLAREAPAVMLKGDRALSADKAPKVHELLQTLARAGREATVARRDAEVSLRVEVPLDPKLLVGALAEMNRVTGRTQRQNNLKQMGLAMHNFHSTFNAFPGGAICDRDGKPLLSWRVAILPFVEELDLYGQFKLDEPWDSDHNKKLLARMPKLYAFPGDPAVAKNETYYRVFTGNGTIFPPKNFRNGPTTIGSRITDIPDGTSNTILVVEAGEAVPWTKPDELVYDADKPLPRLGPSGDGCYAVFADGSAHFLPKTISEKTLRALITAAGGETINYAEFDEGRARQLSAPPRSYPKTQSK